MPRPLSYESGAPPPAREDPRGAYGLLVIGVAFCVFGTVMMVKMWPPSTPLGSHGMPFLLEFAGVMAMIIGPMFVLFASFMLWGASADNMLDRISGKRR